MQRGSFEKGMPLNVSFNLKQSVKVTAEGSALRSCRSRAQITGLSKWRGEGNYPETALVFTLGYIFLYFIGSNHSSLLSTFHFKP